MRVVTIVSLGASAVLGLAALLVAKAMLPNAAAAKATAAPPIVGVPVVVAKAALKFGDRLDASKLVVLKLPSNAVPEGAFSTLGQVLSKDGGGAPVVLTAIAAREPLLPAKLSGPGARASVAAEIGDGFRAYTIKVSDVTGVGGHALPGDRVDVVLMRDLTPDGNIRTYVSEVVTQNIRVLGVDLNADLTSNKPATPSTATLEVSVADAEKLAVAGDLGKLSLALRRTGSTDLAQTSPMRAGAFGGGGGRASGARHRRGAPGVPQPTPNLILIVESQGRGSQGKSASAKPAAAIAAAAAPATERAGAVTAAGKPS
ncbi:Flp pilus assembly protein CpaB [Phenylobacterium sp.]|uniref:Flp pilus assembly protein CpaB n=1 Tax=Phenylobacterium sp. TaxID=1871053 RepID=UPI00286BEF4E|nr:Flp pilus assembly protein CpaB [Phenylobacterium sp.]